MFDLVDFLLSPETSPKALFASSLDQTGNHSLVKQMCKSLQYKCWFKMDKSNVTVHGFRRHNQKEIFFSYPEPEIFQFRGTYKLLFFSLFIFWRFLQKPFDNISLRDKFYFVCKRLDFFFMALESIFWFMEWLKIDFPPSVKQEWMINLALTKNTVTVLLVINWAVSWW